MILWFIGSTSLYISTTVAEIKRFALLDSGVVCFCESLGRVGGARVGPW